MIVVAALLISACNFFTSDVHSCDVVESASRDALGIGEASFGIFAPALLADFYAEDQRNRVLTVFNIAIPVGAALGFLAGGLIGRSTDGGSSFVLLPRCLVPLLRC